MSIKHRLLLAMTFLVIGLSLAFSAINRAKERRLLLKCLDDKLHLAAALASESVPENYHDQIVDETSVPAKDYARIVDKNDKLCREYGLQYLWSCMLVGDRIVFTTSSSSTKGVKKGDYAPFFAVHNNPSAYANVFKTMKTDYSSFHDEWGEGRMVLIPAIDSKGRRYYFGASISLDEVDSALQESLKSNLLLCGWILAAGVIGSIALSTSLTRPIIRLTKAADRIALGDSDHAIGTGGSLEVNSLGKSIALMRDSLNLTISKLKSEIGEHQRTEERLREAEARYRSLFGESPDGIVVIDTETAKFVEFNGTAHRQLGYSRDEFSRLSILDLEASETAEETRAHIAGVIAKGRDDFETRMRTRTGEIRYIHVTAQIISVLGRPVYHCVWRDITERIMTVRALRESQDNYHSLFENMHEGFADCRMVFEDNQPRDAVYLAVNKAFERLTGLRDVVGKAITEVVPGIRESNPELFEIFGRVALTGKPERFETFVKPLGIWLEISVYGPERGCFIAVFDNITEQKQLEKEILMISENEQKRLGQELHDDLGQRMTGLSMFSEVLAKSLKKEGHPQASQAEEITRLFQHTIESARNLAKGFYPIELERGGLFMALLELTQRIDRIGAPSTAALGSNDQGPNRIRCQFRQDQGFQFDEESAIHLYRIVQEAINNAIKHGNPRNILVECTALEEISTVRITDDGVGFTPTGSGAHGMGLHLFQYRARLIGAKIEVANSDAGGCQVTCSLGSPPGKPKPPAGNCDRLS